jgi:hypothetical protein
MTTYEIIIATFIYFATPIIGMLYFVHLRDKMIKAQIKNPPVIELLLVLAIYGILLILILTALFWEWSGFASLGVIFIVFVAPILMAFISVRLQMEKSSTNYHLALQRAALYYFLIFPVSLFLLFWLGKN